MRWWPFKSQLPVQAPEALRQAYAVDTIELTGFALECAVRQELGVGTMWELSDMVTLFLHLDRARFKVSFTIDTEYPTLGRFVCSLERPGQPGMVIESAGENPAVALAKAALAAERAWRIQGGLH